MALWWFWVTRGTSVIKLTKDVWFHTGYTINYDVGRICVEFVQYVIMLIFAKTNLSPGFNSRIALDCTGIVCFIDIWSDCYLFLTKTCSSQGWYHGAIRVLREEFVFCFVYLCTLSLSNQGCFIPHGLYYICNVAFVCVSRFCRVFHEKVLFKWIWCHDLFWFLWCRVSLIDLLLIKYNFCFAKVYNHSTDMYGVWNCA